ncbi:MAG: dihydroorotate dehydrogenase [Acidobacteriota bacterium]|jgi:dihydroorotate dehydrogenase|nr:dihydroorotate dehydrogenase [Acidobacteriota bacterium]
MPDWFYRTVTRPLFFKLPAVQARDFALGFMGRLVRLPLGPAAIDFLGHMRADPRLRKSFLGIDFPTGVGLGPGLDAEARALPALARFGFGFLEVGPVTVKPVAGRSPVARQEAQQAIWSPDPPASLGLAEATPRVAEAARTGLPLIVRLGDGASEVIRELAPHVHLFALDTLARAWTTEAWSAHLAKVLKASPKPVLLCIPADFDTGASADSYVDAAAEAGVAGLLVDGSVAAKDGGRLIGSPAREPALAHVRHWRARHGKDFLLIASGGIHEPADALALRAAGADLVEVDSGVVYSGPGLPKRINDALLYETTRTEPTPTPERAPEMTWFWAALLGAGMLFGSILALGIALTRVVLPYDEAFVGLYAHEMQAINPHLLDFMAHDRVSLAGTMIAIGAMYLSLSLCGIRRGLHWAQQSVFISAFTGFASFFLFLGFGYLDTFHAFVTAVMLQLLLLALHSRLGTHHPDVAPRLREDRAWRRALWGQLLLILHGCGLLGAGIMISVVGITKVFVPQDLEFMHTTAEALAGAHARLVPLVAHDRATLGGMLLASGWVFLLPVLWGFRNGSAWLWWTLLTAGCSAYAAALGVHYSVGYMSLMHLLPAFAGLGSLLLGLGLSYSWLCSPGARSTR